MRRLVISFIMLCAGCSIFDESYPPCHPEEGGEWGPGGPVHGPTDPGPTPGPGPDQANEERYSTLPDGTVCLCGPYESGCVDTAEKAKISDDPGSYCPYPRQPGDPVLAGVFIVRGLKRPPYAEGRCTCYVSRIVCGTQTATTELTGIIGDTAAECAERVAYMLANTPGEVGKEYNIECSPNN